MLHRSLSSTLPLILAALAFTACGSDGDIDAFEDPIAGNDQFNQDQCGKIHECSATYPFSPDMFMAFFGNNAAECITLQDVSPAFEEAVVEAIDAGRTIYSPNNARTCNDTRLGFNCDQFWVTEVPACTAIFTGTIADGGVCTIGVECVSLFCNVQTGQCESF